MTDTLAPALVDAEPDGRDLMLAVTAEVPGAFDALVSAYEQRVKAAVRHHIADCRVVDDLCQEVFLRIFRARHRYVPTARFEAFLSCIVLNLCVNHARYAKLRRTRSLDGARDELGDDAGVIADPYLSSPVESAVAVERGAIVREAVERLPPKQRRAVLLSVFPGMPQDEVAATLGVSSEAVKSLLWRARANLKTRLQPRLAADLW